MLKEKILANTSQAQRAAMRRLLNRVMFLPNYIYDASRFLRASSAARDANNQERLSAQITIDYHRIEKGLALRTPRAGFGVDVIARLISNVSRYEAKFGTGDLTEIVRNVLGEYRQTNEKMGFTSPQVNDFLAIPKPNLSTRAGGTLSVSKEDLFSFETNEIKKFMLTRHSIRQYDGTPISRDLIKDVVMHAQRNAPSVCNRQGARLFVGNDPYTIRKVLSFQNGNSGFGENLSAVFIVAADMRSFTTLGERNQAWVDGGIFAMALANSLHAFKLGSCMLNWSVEMSRDKQMRKEIGIDDNYAIATMMGAGHVQSGSIKIAASPRRPVEDIIHWLVHEKVSKIDDQV